MEENKTTNDSTTHQNQTRVYLDYRYADTAVGDVRKRNHVMDIRDMTLPDPPRECYVGMFRFGEEYYQHWQENGSVKDCPELPCYCDYLWFDIDDEDLEVARKHAIELLTRLENVHDVHPAHCQVCFSGSKGYHIGIPSEMFGMVPDSQNPQKCKIISRQLAGDIPIDTTIYERNRLWRVLGSINAKSGLYKISLTFEELATQDSNCQKEMAASNREINQPTCDLTPNPKLVTLYNEATKSLQDQKSRRTEIKRAVVKDKACINILLDGMKAGSRNEAAVRLADHFKKLEYSEDDAVERLSEWNAKNEPSLDESEIDDTIKSIYSGNYDYGCNDSLLESLCDKNCPLRKGNDDVIKTSFVATPDGSLLEMLYDETRKPATSFARYDGKKVTYVNRWRDTVTGKQYEPYPAEKIIQSNTLELPSEAVDFGSEKELLTEIREFIGKYLYVSPFFHTISTYYVLLSWIYDNFTVLPYLRARGDYGTGKSRFLLAVGVLCYKPISCVGATSVSALFRLIEMYRGTMVVDEADFGESDESNRIIKVLNSGYQKGFPVILSESPKKGQFEPRSFDVFGPKLIATRKEFKDRALESRCVNEIMEPVPHLDLPINLPQSFWDEALVIRNKLLMWRFTKWGKIEIENNHHHSSVEARLAQIMTPLLNIIDDEAVKKEFIAFMQERNSQIIEERGDTIVGKVAKAICDLWADTTEILSNQRITDVTNDSFDNEDFSITPHKTGRILRKEFNLELKRAGQGYVVDRTQENQVKLTNIAKRFGVEYLSEGSTSSTQSTSSAQTSESQEVML